MVKNVNPDIILSFLPRSSFRAILAAKINRKKIIVCDRADPKMEYRKLINKILMKLLYKHADAFVFQTQEQKEYFSKTIQSKSNIIGNSLNNQFLENVKSEVGLEKKIVSVGRLAASKNQKLLINAFSKVHKKFPDYKLVIYGKGPLKEELELQILKLGLEGYVLLPGVKDNIIAEIHNASLFVLTSDYEGMPNALMEAMSLGLPCISTNCSGGRS